MRGHNSLWSKTGIGKYRNRTLPTVIMNDPEWFYWAYHEKVFKGQLLAEAQLIYNYSASILPPKKGYRYEYQNGKALLVQSGGEKFLDLEYPRKQENYNPESSYVSFMEILFGEVCEPYVPTKVAEIFFSNSKNFGYQPKRK